MFSEAKVTEIYCMADDFCKEFVFNSSLNISLTLMQQLPQI